MTETTDDATSPLTGVTVVAVEQAVAAPLCTARLADAGARVIKVERGGGDFARGYDTAAGGDSSYFAWANHGKESVVLDFKDPSDAALLHRIIAAADVFVQNLAPGALERSGFGSPALRAASPRLITCDISGYGDDPSVAGKKAYDLLVQAESGLVAISGGPGELGRIGVSICDIGAGSTAYAAVLEALLRRATTGQGAGLHVSLFDVAAEWMTVPLVQHESGMTSPGRIGLRHPSIAPYGAYATSDGSLTLLSIQNEREWHRLCSQVLARDDLSTDLRFASNNDRVANRDALEEIIDTLFGALDQRELRQRLDGASIAWGAVNGLDELADHPALRRRVIVSSQGIEVTLPAHPVCWSDRTIAPGRRAPAVGDHTERIRAEFAEEAE